MSKVARKFLIGIAIALLIAFLGVGGFFWMSKPQQLKRACWDLVENSLVAPSTAKLVEFHFLSPGSDESITIKKLKSELGVAQLHATEKENSYNSASAAFKSASATSDHIVGNYAIDAQTLHLAAQAADRTLGAMADVTKARNEAYEANTKLTKYLSQKLGEIVLSFDAQNRSGGMIRMEGVCTFSEAARNPSSVELAHLDERGR